MQTLHQVLGRKDERLNLLNVGLCVLVVVILVTITFLVLNGSTSPYTSVTS